MDKDRQNLLVCVTDKWQTADNILRTLAFYTRVPCTESFIACEYVRLMQMQGDGLVEERHSGDSLEFAEYRLTEEGRAARNELLAQDPAIEPALRQVKEHIIDVLLNSGDAHV